jgi:hypothetical protein
VLQRTRDGRGIAHGSDRVARNPCSRCPDGFSAPTRLQLIDFGDVGPCLGADDAVNLELSFAFHALRPQDAWITTKSAEAWAQSTPEGLDERHRELLSVCRDWASDVAQTPADVLVPTYVHALRQLKFGDADPELALAIAASAARDLRHL